MVTGASTADLAIVLVDAREGCSTQIRRHAAIAGAAADPADRARASTRWTSSTTTRTSSGASAATSARWASRLDVEDLACIPISALKGDNVVERSRAAGLVRRADAAAATSRRRPSPPASPTARCGCRSSGSCAPQRAPAPRLRGPARRRHRCGSATRSSCCPRGTRTRVAARSTRRRAGRRGRRAAVGRRAAGGRARRRARGADLRAPASRRGRRARSTRRSAGSARPTAEPRGRYLLKHTTRTVRAVLDTIHHTLEVEKLTERADADRAEPQRDRPRDAAHLLASCTSTATPTTARRARSSSSTRHTNETVGGRDDRWTGR